MCSVVLTPFLLVVFLKPTSVCAEVSLSLPDGNDGDDLLQASVSNLLGSLFDQIENPFRSPSPSPAPSRSRSTDSLLIPTPEELLTDSRHIKELPKFQPPFPDPPFPHSRMEQESSHTAQLPENFVRLKRMQPPGSYAEADPEDTPSPESPKQGSWTVLSEEECKWFCWKPDHFEKGGGDLQSGDFEKACPGQLRHLRHLYIPYSSDARLSVEGVRKPAELALTLREILLENPAALEKWKAETPEGSTRTSFLQHLEETAGACENFQLGGMGLEKCSRALKNHFRGVSKSGIRWQNVYLQTWVHRNFCFPPGHGIEPPLTPRSTQSTKADEDSAGLGGNKKNPEHRDMGQNAKTAEESRHLPLPQQSGEPAHPDNTNSNAKQSLKTPLRQHETEKLHNKAEEEGPEETGGALSLSGSVLSEGQCRWFCWKPSVDEFENHKKGGRGGLQTVDFEKTCPAQSKHLRHLNVPSSADPKISAAGIWNAAGLSLKLKEVLVDNPSALQKWKAETPDSPRRKAFLRHLTETAEVCKNFKMGGGQLQNCIQSLKHHFQNVPESEIRWQNVYVQTWVYRNFCTPTGPGKETGSDGTSTTVPSDSGDGSRDREGKMIGSLPEGSRDEQPPKKTGTEADEASEPDSQGRREGETPTGPDEKAVEGKEKGGVEKKREEKGPGSLAGSESGPVLSEGQCRWFCWKPSIDEFENHKKGGRGGLQTADFEKTCPAQSKHLRHLNVPSSADPKISAAGIWNAAGLALKLKEVLVDNPSALQKWKAETPDSPRRKAFLRHLTETAEVCTNFKMGGGQLQNCIQSLKHHFQNVPESEIRWQNVYVQTWVYRNFCTPRGTAEGPPKKAGTEADEATEPDSQGRREGETPTEPDGGGKKKQMAPGEGDKEKERETKEKQGDPEKEEQKNVEEEERGGGGGGGRWGRWFCWKPDHFEKGRGDLQSSDFDKTCPGQLRYLRHLYIPFSSDARVSTEGIRKPAELALKLQQVLLDNPEALQKWKAETPEGPTREEFLQHLRETAAACENFSAGGEDLEGCVQVFKNYFHKGSKSAIRWQNVFVQTWVHRNFCSPPGKGNGIPTPPKKDSDSTTTQEDGGGRVEPVGGDDESVGGSGGVVLEGTPEKVPKFDDKKNPVYSSKEIAPKLACNFQFINSRGNSWMAQSESGTKKRFILALVLTDSSPGRTLRSVKRGVEVSVTLLMVNVWEDPWGCLAQMGADSLRVPGKGLSGTGTSADGWVGSFPLRGEEDEDEDEDPAQSVVQILKKAEEEKKWPELFEETKRGSFLPDILVIVLDRREGGGGGDGEEEKTGDGHTDPVTPPLKDNGNRETPRDFGGLLVGSLTSHPLFFLWGFGFRFFSDRKHGVVIVERQDVAPSLFIGVNGLFGNFRLHRQRVQAVPSLPPCDEAVPLDSDECEQTEDALEGNQMQCPRWDIAVKPMGLFAESHLERVCTGEGSPEGACISPCLPEGVQVSIPPSVKHRTAQRPVRGSLNFEKCVSVLESSLEQWREPLSGSSLSTLLPRLRSSSRMAVMGALSDSLRKTLGESLSADPFRDTEAAVKRDSLTKGIGAAVVDLKTRKVDVVRGPPDAAAAYLLSLLKLLKQSQPEVLHRALLTEGVRSMTGSEVQTVNPWVAGQVAALIARGSPLVVLRQAPDLTRRDFQSLRPAGGLAQAPDGFASLVPSLDPEKLGFNYSANLDFPGSPGFIRTKMTPASLSWLKDTRLEIRDAIERSFWKVANDSHVVVEAPESTKNLSGPPQSPQAGRTQSPSGSMGVPASEAGEGTDAGDYPAASPPSHLQASHLSLKGGSDSQGRQQSTATQPLQNRLILERRQGLDEETDPGDDSFLSAEDLWGDSDEGREAAEVLAGERKGSRRRKRHEGRPRKTEKRLRGSQPLSQGIWRPSVSSLQSEEESENPTRRSLSIQSPRLVSSVSSFPRGDGKAEGPGETAKNPTWSLHRGRRRGIAFSLPSRLLLSAAGGGSGEKSKGTTMEGEGSELRSDSVPLPVRRSQPDSAESRWINGGIQSLLNSLSAPFEAFAENTKGEPDERRRGKTDSASGIEFF
uniref:Uncharacterized protein n=1 Tax=Chromera velia CCMP2878 TaxID=1169474 RepID=A0A0G4HCZ1_9ALVE